MARTRTGNKRTLPAEVHRARRRGLVRGVAVAFLRLLGAIAVVATTFGGVIAAYLWLTTTPHLAVRDVRFEGNAQARLESLVELARIKTGTNLWRIDTAGIERRLSRHPWIRTAHVRREWPAGLSIHLVEHQARAMAVHDGIYLVDERGTTFKTLEAATDPKGLPVITGLDGEMSPAVLQARLLEALAVLDLWNKNPGRRPLAEIHRDPVRGLSLTLAETKEAPPLVAHLGRTDLGPRMKRLDQLLQLLFERGEQPREVFVEGHTRPQWVVARVD